MRKLEIRLILVCIGFAAPVTAGEALLAESDGIVWVWLGFAALMVSATACRFFLLLCAVDAIGERNWKRFIVAIALPGALLALQSSDPNGDPLYAARLPTFVGDVIHFASLKPRYDAIVSALPSTQNVRVFIWNSDFMASWGIVYDGTGKLRRDPATRMGELCNAHPLWDHYFLATFGC